MVDKTRILQKICDTELLARNLPLWAEWGVEDCGVSIHSLGLAWILIAGFENGFSGVSELPAPRRGEYRNVVSDVRSDGVWFDKIGGQVVLLAEFERYSGRQKDLSPKVENLLLAQHRWGNPEALLLLAYWTEGLQNLPDHEALRNIVVSGYSTAAKERVAGGFGGKLCFLQFIMQKGSDNLLRLHKIIVRGQ